MVSTRVEGLRRGLLSARPPQILSPGQMRTVLWRPARAHVVLFRAERESLCAGVRFARIRDCPRQCITRDLSAGERWLYSRGESLQLRRFICVLSAHSKAA